MVLVSKRRDGALLAVVAIIMMIGGGAARAAAPADDIVDVPPLPPGAETAPLHISRVGSKMTTGQNIGRLKAGMFCLPGATLSYSANQNASFQEKLSKAFYAEASSLGFKTPPTETNLFADDTSTGDYAIGVLLESEEIDLCLAMAGFGDNNAKGKASYGLEWQVYSNLEHKIVADIHTDGTYAASTGLPDTFLEQAIKINARKVLADPAFRTVYLNGGRPPEALAPSTGLSVIKIVNSGDGPASIPDSTASVVEIVAGQGFGSGFLIDSTGLLITNRHVVGDSRFVKVKWSDGSEGLGEVIRSDERRDVAVLRTDPKGRKPLRIAGEAPVAGDAVFAIGTPLDQKFQSTVTKGVVSGVRVIGGLSFIQSDVVVNHGNSGGPLLNAKGEVIGVTQSGYQIGGASTGINLFVPMRDALDFLALKP